MIYVTAAIERLQTEKQEVENGVDVENPFLSAFRQFQNIDKLARDILIELVDQIKVYEGGSIRIVFCFADELRRVKEYIEVDTHNEDGRDGQEVKRAARPRRGMTKSERFFRWTRQKIAGILCVFQDFLTLSSGKRSAIWAF